MATVSEFTKVPIAVTRQSTGGLTNPQTADGGFKVMEISSVRALGDTYEMGIQTAGRASTVGPAHVSVGVWMTPEFPESVTIKGGTTFNMTKFFCHEGASTLNAYPKVRIYTIASGTASNAYKTLLADWNEHTLEMGTTVSSGNPLGNNTSHRTWIINAPGTDTTINVGDRLCVEVALNITGSKTGSCYFEYNGHYDYSNGQGASQIVFPFNMSETYQESVGEVYEVLAPYGTSIAMADIGTAWTSAKWSDATHLTHRQGTSYYAQAWVKQDATYLYIATNYIIDGCIQSSDHQSVFLSIGSSWKSALTPATGDFLFSRDITAGTSSSRSGVLGALGSNTYTGEHIWKGNSGKSGTFPYYWDTVDWTNAANGWVESTDFRAGGPGAASSATPNPNGGNGTGAYSEFAIKKSTLGWNGVDEIGFMIIVQCDVQGDGHTMFPYYLGNRIDKTDWNYAGLNYTSSDGKTASSSITADPIDLRPLMGTHLHGMAITTKFVGFMFGNPQGAF